MIARRGSAARALLSAPALLAIAVLVVNDHVLKARCGGWWTGKLSDVTGLVFFPLLLAGAIELLGDRAVGQGGVIIAAVATAVVFAAVKLWAPAGELYRVGLAALQWPVRAAVAVGGGALPPGLGRARLTADATDLLALPALVVPILVAGARRRGRG